jgi:starch synthase
MESLPMTTKYLSCKSSLSSSSSSTAVLAKFNHFRVIGQVGFAPLWRRSGRGCLRLRASVSGDTIGGSQDGPSAVEDDKEKKGLILGTERDGSGSVIGFHLIPQSGMDLFYCEVVYLYFASF